MGTAKRERQRQGRQARLAQAYADQARSRRARGVRNAVILVALLVFGAFLWSLRGSDDTEPVAATDQASSEAPTDETTTTVAAPVVVPITVPAAGESVSGATPCPPADGSAARTTTFENAPPTCIRAGRTYTAEVATSKGDFTIRLDADSAPDAVNNFVTLARYHYYDGVAFHRIVAGFVNQTGDAVGPRPGTGGPGYTFGDELPADASVYGEGAVAMANSGPDTNASQWFVVVGDGGSRLEPKYSKFGQVTEGIEVVRAINALPTDNPQSADPTTTELVTVTSVTITEE